LNAPKLEVGGSIVRVDAGQTADTGVDVRQQRSHGLQLEALETPDADSEHGVDEHERGSCDRDEEEEPGQDGGDEGGVDGNVEQRSHRVVGQHRQPRVH